MKSLQSDVGAQDLVGVKGLPLRINLEGVTHKKIFQRGIHMRKNLLSGNYRGWRAYANQNAPLLEITDDTDLSRVKKEMGYVPKMMANDDIKVDWDDKYLVIFHFLRLA